MFFQANEGYPHGLDRHRAACDPPQLAPDRCTVRLVPEAGHGEHCHLLEIPETHGVLSTAAVIEVAVLRYFDIVDIRVETQTASSRLRVSVIARRATCVLAEGVGDDGAVSRS